MNQPSPAVHELAQSLGGTSQRERAVAAFEWVRDNIEFGFTPLFDYATPDDTLRMRIGHCNPQAVLFASLLSAIGLESRVHFVHIKNDILFGLFPSYAGPPPILSHSWTEVKLDDGWVALDGYIVDPGLRKGASRVLQSEGRAMGYGIHIDGSGNWDGIHDCMSQCVSPGMILKDCGQYCDADEFLSSQNNVQQLNTITTRLYSCFSVGPANEKLNELRQD